MAASKEPEKTYKEGYKEGYDEAAKALSIAQKQTEGAEARVKGAKATLKAIEEKAKQAQVDSTHYLTTLQEIEVMAHEALIPF